MLECQHEKYQGDRLFATVSWFVAVALIFAAANVWFAPPAGAGHIAGALGILGSQIFYSALYGLEALVLGFAKWKRRDKMRKHTLLVIYLTGFFTTLLTILLVGFTPKVIDNFAIAVAAAWCWLHLTFRTEYVDIEVLDDEKSLA